MHLRDALQRVAESRAEDPLRPVTFVAPTRVAALALRRELASFAPYAAVRFETLPRLAELAGAAELAAQGRRPLARPIGDYAAGMVARASQAPLNGIAELPGFARILRRHFQRLRRGGVRSGTDLPQQRDPAATEFLRAYDAFRERIAGFYDDEDLFDAAVAAVTAGRSGVTAELGDIYIVPPGPTSAGADALVSAFARAGVTVVAIEDEAVRVRPVIRLLPDPASEADDVARQVLELLGRGAALHEIAVFHGADRAYSAMLAASFLRAGIEVTRTPGRPLLETQSGRAVMALLSLPLQDFSRVAVMDFFGLGQTPREVPGGDAGGVRVRSTQWDRISREAGVTHGEDRWRQALQAMAGDYLDRAGQQENDEWRARIEEDAATAAELAGVVTQAGERLRPLLRPQNAQPFIAVLREVVRTYVRADAEGFEEVLDEIDQLGTVASIGGEFALAVFNDALEANLRTAAIREGRFGQGVLVTDFRAAAGLSFKHVIVCGACEGAFPPGGSIQPVVDDVWWSEVHALIPYVENEAARIARERAAARRALAAASESLTVTVPLASASGGQERYPAPLVAEVVSEFSGMTVTPSDIRRGVAVGSSVVARPGSPLAAAASGPALDIFERELRQAVASARAGEGAGGGRLARAVESRRLRRAARLTEWDGLVDIGQPLLPLERQLSATSVEAYSECGFRFFLRHVIGVRGVDDPEELQTMEPAQRGTLVHRVLKLFFDEAQRAGRPQAMEPWSGADEARLLQILDAEMEAAQRRGLAGLPIFHAHQLATLRADLQRFLREDTQERASRSSVPWAFEWQFEGVAIGGRQFRGSADRVDHSTDGRSAWVVDYKTGRADSYKETPGDPFNGAQQLQLGIYASALAQREGLEVRGSYWFITQRGDFAQRSYEHTPANAALLDRIVRAIDAGVTQGSFPAVPGDENQFGGFTNCHFCDYDRICGRKRGADFARRADHETLAPWANVEFVARGAP